ncbi:MAG: potassium/proton antiporter, partial [Muribaculaceae bacterium]|nr:potassium/proton antiporter [Muribaculaceae bacterium]
VFGILGSQKVTLQHNLRPMLELESGSNDPMAYMLTIILLEAISIDSGLSAGRILLELAMQFGIGIAGGYALAKFTIWLIGAYCRIGRNSGFREDSSQTTSMTSILTIGCVFLTFSITTALSGNGYLAVYIAGIVLGNAHIPNSRGIGKFIDSMTWLAQIVVFLMLGLLVNPHEMLDVAAVSLLIGVFMITVGRPLSVFLSLAPLRKINLRSKLFVSWVGLRGAVPIIFATYPVVANIEGAGQIFNIVFFVTLLSLLVQGTTVINAAKRLRLIDNNAPADDDFGVELSEDLPTSLHTLTLTEKDLSHGNTLSQMQLPSGSLVMMVRRGSEHLVPNGSMNLRPGDILLIIRND